MKALPKPPGMTESGDEKKRTSIGGVGERRREKRGEREKPNGIFGKWNEEIKGFSLSATHGQQITDLFGDRVYIEARRDEYRRTGTSPGYRDDNNNESIIITSLRS